MSIIFCTFCSWKGTCNLDVLMIKRILTKKGNESKRKDVKRMEKLKVIKDNTLVNINFYISGLLRDKDIGNMEKAADISWLQTDIELKNLNDFKLTTFILSFFLFFFFFIVVSILVKRFFPSGENFFRYQFKSIQWPSISRCVKFTFKWYI